MADNYNNSNWADDLDMENPTMDDQSSTGRKGGQSSTDKNDGNKENEDKK